MNIPRRIAGSPLRESPDKEILPIAPDLFGKNDICVLQVCDDSMARDHLLAGDYIIVKKSNAAKNGELVLALVRDTETTLKRLGRDEHRIRLESEDTSQEALVLDESEVAIQGIVMGILRKYRNP